MSNERSPYKEAKERSTASRTCLVCGDGFGSTGPGNRICPKCQKGYERSSSTGKPIRTRIRR